MRKKEIDEKKEIVANQLMQQRTQLKQLGFEKLEELRKQKDKEFLAMIPTFNYEAGNLLSFK